jgi:hypothetical protein
MAGLDRCHPLTKFSDESHRTAGPETKPNAMRLVSQTPGGVAQSGAKKLKTA